MKLHLSGPTGHNLFTGYGTDYVMINHVRYDHSLIVLPDRLIEEWKAKTFEESTLNTSSSSSRYSRKWSSSERAPPCVFPIRN